MPLVTLLLFAACDGTTAPQPLTCTEPGAGAVVTFLWDSRPDTLDVLVCDAASIAAAEEYIVTQSGPHIPSGPIVRGAGVDPDVPFQFIPDSVRLVEVGIEICDGKMMRTPAEVNEYFQGATGSANSPKAPFCPWGTRPIVVSTLPAS